MPVAPANGIFSQEQIERARAYHRPLERARLAGSMLNLAVLAAIVFTGLGDDLYALTTGLPWWARTLVFSMLVVALATALDLPIAFWAGYLHEHEWALSKQSLAGWFVDRLKGLAVGLVITTVALVGLIGAARLWPVHWPVIVGAFAAILVLILSFVAPIILEPLFSRFAPLSDRELASRLETLAAKAEAPVKKILVADASRRTQKVNAYVSGLGRTRRVVLFDTLLSGADPGEVELVVAHELGHRRRRHVAKGTILGMFGAAAFVALLWALLARPSLRSAIGVTGADDPRVVPFFWSDRRSASSPRLSVHFSPGAGSERPTPSRSS